MNLTYPTYNWGYNLLTKWDDPPSRPWALGPSGICRITVHWLCQITLGRWALSRVQKKHPGSPYEELFGT